ncbi:MAG: protein-export chaperone SecB [Rickettsiales bacterium]|jgi:preprotein translocase subunit SecB|nr:protein-export chaperone SecB [Rickettsiales bacterium]
MISKINGADIVINYQYLKDLNFENPKAPSVYSVQSFRPDTRVSFDINATRLQETVFEVEIVINVVANSDKRVGKEINMFNLDITYAGVFTIKDVPDSLVQENLFIDCPTLIFPFMRRIIADTVRDANFPPLMVDMIDFEKIYDEKKEGLRNV